MPKIREQLGKLEWEPSKKLTHLEFDVLTAQMKQEIEEQGWEWSTQDFTLGGIAFYTPINESMKAEEYLQHQYGCAPAEDYIRTQNGKNYEVLDPANDSTGFSPLVGRYKIFDADAQGVQKMFRLTVRNPE